jgi:hypothetical protein
MSRDSASFVELFLLCVDPCKDGPFPGAFPAAAGLGAFPSTTTSQSRNLWRLRNLWRPCSRYRVGEPQRGSSKFYNIDSVLARPCTWLLAQEFTIVTPSMLWSEAAEDKLKQAAASFLRLSMCLCQHNSIFCFWQSTMPVLHGKTLNLSETLRAVPDKL